MNKPYNLFWWLIMLEAAQPRITSLLHTMQSMSRVPSMKCMLFSFCSLIVYPPLPQPERITVTSEDIPCLSEGEFLNDVIIDFYLKWVDWLNLKKYRSLIARMSKMISIITYNIRVSSREWKTSYPFLFFLTSWNLANEQATWNHTLGVNPFVI